MEEAKLTEVSKIQKEIQTFLRRPEEMSPQRGILILTKLQMIEISWDILAKSGVAHTVNDLRKATKYPEVQKRGKLLLKRWKNLDRGIEVVNHEDQPGASRDTTNKPEIRIRTTKNKLSSDDPGTSGGRPDKPEVRKNEKLSTDKHTASGVRSDKPEVRATKNKVSTGEPAASGDTHGKPEIKKKKVSTDIVSGIKSVQRLGVQEQAQVGKDNSTAEGHLWKVQIIDELKLKLTKRFPEG